MPTLVVVTSLAIFALAMITASLSGARTVKHQSEEYFLSSAVESAAILTAEKLWSGFLEDSGGAAGTINDFRNYLTATGIADAGAGGAPSAEEGTNLLSFAKIPGSAEGNPELNNVNIDALNVVRRDDGDSTQLWITVSASTNRGMGIVNPVLNRAVQQVYTVEPEDFQGFEYGILANNVNCVFCHTTVDSVERYFNEDAEQFGTFDRVKIGTLESLMIRHEMDGKWWVINDFDADSYVAGTIYVRGTATDHDGNPLADWADLSFGSFEFDDDGKIMEDAWGDLQVDTFQPADDPPDPLENLYLDYAENYSEMVDGNLPSMFPAPIPDDGGIDPATGLPDPTGADNKVVDPNEFFAVAEKAEGAITAGILYEVPAGQTIDTVNESVQAFFVGNTPSIQQSVGGHVILTGTEEDPITIDGTVAIDGDVIVNGYIKGEGTIVASGNIYIPTDLQYLDGFKYLEGDPQGSPSGPETFGVAQDGTKNALGLAAGGNVLIGDYLKPATLQPDWQWIPPEKYEIVTGEDDGPWNFSLAEISSFNRTEWAKTQALLPGPGEDTTDPSTWTVSNDASNGGSFEGSGYVPRYYQFGPGDMIPLYIEGSLHWDATTETWKGDAEVPIGWNEDLLAYAEPDDPNDPFLYNADGTPKAVVYPLTSTDGFVDDFMYKQIIEYFEDNRPYGTPMRIDGLVYTNNAVFSLVHRYSTFGGGIMINGALVAADLGLLAPGKDTGNLNGPGTQPGSTFQTGLQLNYDRRIKDMLNVVNPFQVQIKRTLWNPTANVL